MRDLPQVHPDSGISADYFNEYFARMMAYDMNRIDFLNEICNDYPVKKYEERYPKDKFNYTIGPELRKKIDELNGLAELCNKEFDGRKPFDENVFKELINNVYKLLHGTNELFYK